MIRIGTLNVHCWRRSDYANNVEQVAEAISQSGCHVMALQEITKDGIRNEKGFQRHIDRLNKILGWKFAVVGSSRIANAIISKYPLDDQLTYQIHGHVSEKYYRSLIGARIKVSEENDLCLLATHLDHISEAIRMAQLTDVLEHVVKRSPPHIFMGDLNSLKRQDYDVDALNAISEHRAKSGWEQPRFDVIDTLEGHGYVDLLDGYDRKSKRAGRSFTTRATNWAGTRIDFIFASHGLAWRKVDAGIIDSPATDHSLVWVELECNHS